MIDFAGVMNMPNPTGRQTGRSAAEVLSQGHDWGKFLICPMQIQALAKCLPPERAGHTGIIAFENPQEAYL
jgi:hypothetical protein